MEMKFEGEDAGAELTAQNKLDGFVVGINLGF